MAGGTINLNFNAQATTSEATAGASDTIQHPALITIAMAAAPMFKKNFLVPTSAAAIDFGQISGAPALIIIQNRDATNYLEIGGDSGLTVFKLRLAASSSGNGGIAIFTETTGTVYWKAHTAAVAATISAYSA